MVQMPSKFAAMTAFREAGATAILPVEDDPEGEDALDGPDPFAKWMGLNAKDLIVGEVELVEQPWWIAGATTRASSPSGIGG